MYPYLHLHSCSNIIKHPLANAIYLPNNKTTSTHPNLKRNQYNPTKQTPVALQAPPTYSQWYTYLHLHHHPHNPQNSLN